MSDLALPFLMFVWANAGKARRRASPPPRPAPTRRTRARRLPPPTTTTRPAPPPVTVTPAAALPTGTPPWPQVTPRGLPPFPGSGWEYDRPPPAAVQARAKALLSQLWRSGAGTFKVEQTAGRWIAYRAATTAGNKRGVVAYRVKAAPPSSAPVASSTPRYQPASASVRLQSLKAGHFYALRFSAPKQAAAVADAIRLALVSRYSATTSILASRVEPATTQTRILLTVKLRAAERVRIGASIVLQGVPVTLVSATEIVPRSAPTPAVTPGRVVQTSTTHQTPTGTITAKSPIELPTLRYGMGLRPQPANDDVKTLQRKLGIAADGRFGSGTRSAVKTFQSSRRLVADGIVGPKTWTALFGGQI